MGQSKSYFSKFKHDFKATVDRVCQSNDGIEDMEHILLPVLPFSGVVSLPRPFGYANLSSEACNELLFYSISVLPQNIRRYILH